MSKKNIHIVPDGPGHWNVVREGNPRAISSHRTQGAADKSARPIARRDEVELVTHSPDGTIRDKDSFGNDPNPPKDTRH